MTLLNDNSPNCSLKIFLVSGAKLFFHLLLFDSSHIDVCVTKQVEGLLQKETFTDVILRQPSGGSRKSWGRVGWRHFAAPGSPPASLLALVIRLTCYQPDIVGNTRLTLVGFNFACVMLGQALVCFIVIRLGLT